MIQPIAPCLWFDGNAEEAVQFYLSVFPNSRVTHVDRYNEVGPDPDAPVVYIAFELNGQPFGAINGGPAFSFTEAISFAIPCADQAEVDFYWDALLAGGESMACGWLKDRYGVAWQVVPQRLFDMLRDPDRERAGRAMRCMLEMTKLDVAALEAAFAGEH